MVHCACGVSVRVLFLLCLVVVLLLMLVLGVRATLVPSLRLVVVGLVVAVRCISFQGACCVFLGLDLVSSRSRLLPMGLGCVVVLRVVPVVV